MAYIGIDTLPDVQRATLHTVHYRYYVTTGLLYDALLYSQVTTLTLIVQIMRRQLQRLVIWGENNGTTDAIYAMYRNVEIRFFFQM